MHIYDGNLQQAHRWHAKEAYLPHILQRLKVFIQAKRNMETRVHTAIPTNMLVAV